MKSESAVFRQSVARPALGLRVAFKVQNMTDHDSKQEILTETDEQNHRNDEISIFLYSKPLLLWPPSLRLL